MCKKIMKSFTKIFPILISFITLSVNAQTILEKYIKEGLENNIVLQQKKTSYNNAEYSLRIAQSYFLPSVDFQSSYTSGEGGRNISLAVGDLMNPVYQTLNKLTGSNSFPQIENINEDLIPKKLYDAKLRVSMPLLNSDLVFNSKIQSQQVQIKEYEIELYKRQLAKEIKIAYFNYLSSRTSVSIYDNALELSNEGKRVNESLIKNGSGLPVYILRSESEIENLKARKNEAENQSLIAKRYFNFLLNRNLDSEINTNFPLEIENAMSWPEQDADNVLMNREEIFILKEGMKINQSLVDKNRLSWLPKISTFIDLGIQDQGWKFNKQSKYYLFGIQLEVPLFEGFRSDYRTHQAELDLKNAKLNLEITRHQLQLGLGTASGNLKESQQNYQSSLKQLETASNYYRLVIKGYQEGTNSFIETIDARTQRLNSELLVNINKCKVLIALANYEYETVSEKY